MKSLSMVLPAVVAAVVATAASAAPPPIAAHEYPTVERVEYVHTCMRENDGQPQEMVYKCSCLIDAIAKQLTYDEFVEASTAAYAYSIGGERGETVRAYAPAKTMADRFRAVQTAGKKSCFFH